MLVFTLEASNEPPDTFSSVQTTTRDGAKQAGMMRGLKEHRLTLVALVDSLGICHDVEEISRTFNTS